LLDEVERMCDHVTVLHQGKVAVQGPVDQVRSAHRVSQLRYPTRLDFTPDLEGALSIAGDGRSWTVVHTSPLEAVRATVAGAGGEIIESRIATLEEILIARVRRVGRPRQAA
jgi:ABC-2 type transport system ATP-binding protein